MSILKTKVAKAREMLVKKTGIQETMKIEVKVETIQDNQLKEKVSPIKRQRRKILQPEPKPATPPRGSTSSKNIMKNYSRALTNFALSPMALPYLKPIFQDSDSKIKDFIDFVECHKEKANCIKGLRTLLLIEHADSKQIADFKAAFQKVSIIFLKFFCVNWIYNSKIADKKTHLKYRFKILRRVKNPICFTYLEEFAS